MDTLHCMINYTIRVSLSVKQWTFQDELKDLLFD